MVKWFCMRNALILFILALGIAFFGIGIEPLADTISKRYASITAAVITNDSTSVDLEGFGASGDAQSDAVNSGGNTAGSDSSSVMTQTTGNGENALLSASVIEKVVITYIPSGSNSASASSAQTGSANQSNASPHTESVVESAADFLATLIGNQAVSISGNASGSGISSGISSDAVIHVDGDSVRGALHARGITEVALPFRSVRGGLIQRLQSKEDFTLTVASRALSNARIDEVALASGVVSVSYQAQGRLFAVVPVRFLVKVSVDPLLETAEERVRVRFPWYKFFLQTHVSKKALRSDLDAAIGDIRAEDRITIDTHARLFEIIVHTLENRFDTVLGSITPR